MKSILTAILMMVSILANAGPTDEIESFTGPSFFTVKDGQLAIVDASKLDPIAVAKYSNNRKVYLYAERSSCPYFMQLAVKKDEFGKWDAGCWNKGRKYIGIRYFNSVIPFEHLYLVDDFAMDSKFVNNSVLMY